MLCLSDGTKWQVWYYAELAAKMPEHERLRELECFAQIDWLYIFETHCGRAGRRGSAVHRRDHASVPVQRRLSADLAATRYGAGAGISGIALAAVCQGREASAHDEAALQMEPDYADGHFSQGTR